MKFRSVLLLSMILSGAFAAAAQETASLKKLKAGEVFADPGRKFSVAVPAAGFETDNEESDGPGEMKDVTVRYRWKLREGHFSISTHTFNEDVYGNPLLIQLLMARTANSFKEEGAEIISRTNIEIGGVNGAELVRKEKTGSKVIYRIFGWKNILFTVNASFKASDKESGELMKTAIESFKFLELEKPAAPAGK